MEFLEVPIFDEDIFKLLVRLTINLVFVSFLIVRIYFPFQRKRTYVFAFFMMNLVVFFLCFTLKKLELGLGMALGLFAIFGILRYRTDTIKIKEMTYLFIVVGIAVVNALSNRKTSYAELALANVSILLACYALEKFCYVPKLSQQNLVYDNPERLRPENREALLAELSERTGLNIRRVEVKRIDLRNGTANITAHYAKS